MKKNWDFFKLANAFFLLTFLLLLVLYLRWLLITPFIFENKLDLALVIIYGTLIAVYTICKNSQDLQAVVFPLVVCCFFANLWCLAAYAPAINNFVVCNKSIYYISSFHPFGDYQWIESRITRWDSVLSYETFFFGYEPWAFDIVCDEEKNEINLLKASPIGGELFYTYGQNSRGYLSTIAQINNSLYAVAEECLVWSDNYCDDYIYTLYECNLDYKSCDPLPVQYVYGDYIYGDLKVDETTNEINFYDDFVGDPALIFTYGENPRCYVKGCKILEGE